MNDDIERECRELIKTWRTVAEQERGDGVEFPPKMACLDTHEQLADELEAVLDGETPLEAADEKPCGTHHPLPCGLDVACPEVEDGE